MGKDSEPQCGYSVIKYTGVETRRGLCGFTAVGFFLLPSESYRGGTQVSGQMSSANPAFIAREDLPTLHAE